MTCGQQLSARSLYGIWAGRFFAPIDHWRVTALQRFRCSPQTAGAAARLTATSQVGQRRRINATRKSTSKRSASGLMPGQINRAECPTLRSGSSPQQLNRPAPAAGRPRQQVGNMMPIPAGQHGPSQDRRLVGGNPAHWHLNGLPTTPEAILRDPRRVTITAMMRRSSDIVRRAISSYVNR